MFNQRGQAFDVFKLLIAAVVAVVILTILLSILNVLPPLFVKNLPDEGKSLLSEALQNKATKVVSTDILVSKGATLTDIGLVSTTNGNLSDGQLCVLKGDFRDSVFWTGTDGVSISYNSSSNLKIGLVGICDTSSRMNGSDYFSKYVGQDIPSDWAGVCPCVTANNDDLCCIVALKKK